MLPCYLTALLANQALVSDVVIELHAAGTYPNPHPRPNPDPNPNPNPNPNQVTSQTAAQLLMLAEEYQARTLRLRRPA